MKNLLALAFADIGLIFASETRSAVEFLPVVPAGVEALSLMGQSLISPAADAATIEKFEAAEAQAKHPEQIRYFLFLRKSTTRSGKSVKAPSMSASK